MLTPDQLADLRAAIRETLPEAMWRWHDPIEAARLGLRALQDERDKALVLLRARARPRLRGLDVERLADELRAARAERDAARERVYKRSKDSTNG